MFILKLALVLLVVLTGLAFHVRNGQLVVIDLYLGSYEISLSMALVIALGAGAVLGVLACFPTWLKLQRDRARLGKQLKDYQNSVE